MFENERSWNWYCLIVAIKFSLTPKGFNNMHSKSSTRKNVYQLAVPKFDWVKFLQNCSSRFNLYVATCNFNIKACNLQFR